MKNIEGVGHPEGTPMVDNLREEDPSIFELLYKVGIALSAEKNKDRLVEMILLEAKNLCHADGGTLYIRTDHDELRFAIMRTDSLGISMGGMTGAPITIPPLPLYKNGVPNEANVATCTALRKQSFNVPDAYQAVGFDFSGTKAFDERNHYRSRSILTIPLVNSDDTVIAVIQLLNATDPVTKEVISFRLEHQRIVEALASQAAIALDNQMLLEGQKHLLESFIKMIASSIDAKSPYTGGHCERVPILTEMITQKVCEATEGPFKDFNLTPEEWYELRIAAWMHDCGKVITPTHVMDKATKLETIWDRIDMVKARFEVLRREAELTYWKGKARGEDETALRAAYESELKQLDDELAFLEKANIGGEYLAPDKQAYIGQIGKRSYVERGQEKTLLTQNEIENLQISRGTLTEPERIVINYHMVHTIRMLEALPFPRSLKRVPEYAGGHHEKMDGGGYPKGLYAGDMSVPARIMAIADVFEALTAQDRPYKKGKTLSESMSIMGFMKRDNHLDPQLFDLFVSSGVYKEYAKMYLPTSLIDEVNEKDLLAIQPKPFEMPPDDVRRLRWKDFLPQYVKDLKKSA